MFILFVLLLNVCICPRIVYEDEYMKVKATGGEAESPDFKLDYQGDLNKKNQAHGKGILNLPDGSFYEGSFRKNKKHGFGILVAKNGDIYEGEFKRDEQHGYGVLKEKSGDVYSGEWIQGEQHGKGRYVWVDNSVFEGEWRNGQPFNGEWKDGKSGDVYIGEFKDGLIHGKGKYYTFESDNIFEGLFFEGKAIKKSSIEI